MKKNSLVGGAATNKHGLKFEKQTDLKTRIANDLSDKYELLPHKFKNQRSINSVDKSVDVKRLTDGKIIGLITKQNDFYNALKDLYGLDNTNHKRWKPDEVFFNTETNTVFVVEKKWQETAGSVDEKMFGFVNKRKLYQRIFNHLPNEPKPTVQFAALFNSSWFIDKDTKYTYQDYFDNLREDGIKIFFDNYDYWWFGL